MPGTRARKWVAPVCAAAVLLGACSSSGSSATGSSSTKRPNIVFVLTDDLDLTSYTADPNRFPVYHDLMARQGTTFANHFVTDSLCCPSRASILRGQYVHNHGVQDNLPPNGGFERWQQLGLDSSTVATWLHAAGYTTGLFGKYLNGYPNTVAADYVPPGWDDWVSPSAGNPYAEYNYQLNENGKLHDYGAAPSDYLVDVLARKSDAFIEQQAGRHPFFLYVAPYVPHQPATPAPRHAHAFPEARLPHPPSWNQADVASEPAYVGRRPPLGPAVVAYEQALYRRRLQSMLGVEDLLAGIVRTLRRTGQLDDTYIVFTSDNGFHLGEHRLPFGKQTPYDTDTHVPLAVRGPGVRAGRTVRDLTAEIDLAPTFAEWAHAKAPTFVDGVSLAPLLAGLGSSSRTDVLVEHYANGDVGAKAARRAARRSGSDSTNPDDDANPPTAGAPTGAARPLPKLARRLVGVAIPPYGAVRTARDLYVEYATGERQLFDVQADPYEIHNLAPSADPALLARLQARLAALRTCAGVVCRR